VGWFLLFITVVYLNPANQVIGSVSCVYKVNIELMSEKKIESVCEHLKCEEFGREPQRHKASSL
jgi:hypothetical protein